MNNPTPTPEIVENWKQEFESRVVPILRRLYPPHDHASDSWFLIRQGNGYLHPMTNAAWDIFLMARSTVVIPLPNPINAIQIGHFMDGDTECLIDWDVQVAIESRGYKTRRGE